MSTAEIPKFPLIINGSRCKPASGEYMDVVNPATGEVVASAARGNTTDVDVAVAAAKAAFNNPQWGSRDFAAKYCNSLCRPCYS